MSAEGGAGAEVSSGSKVRGHEDPINKQQCIFLLQYFCDCLLYKTMVNTTVGVPSGSSFSFYNCSVLLKPKHPLQCTWINSCVQSLCGAGSSSSSPHHQPSQHHCEQPADNYNTTLVPLAVDYHDSSNSSTYTTSAVLLSTVVICLVLALVVLGVTLWNVYQHFLHSRLLNWPAANTNTTTTTRAVPASQATSEQLLQSPLLPLQQHGSASLGPRRSRYTNGFGTVVVPATSTSTTSREL